MYAFKKRIALLASASLIIFLLISIGVFPPQGESLFHEQKCSTCHRFKGKGGMAGPDLTDVTKRRSCYWLMVQIKNPMLNNPASRMPGYGSLGHLEILAIIAYLKFA